MVFDVWGVDVVAVLGTCRVIIGVEDITCSVDECRLQSIDTDIVFLIMYNICRNGVRP